jgi:hypothetical protein
MPVEAGLKMFVAMYSTTQATEVAITPPRHVNALPNIDSSRMKIHNGIDPADLSHGGTVAQQICELLAQRTLV